MLEFRVHSILSMDSLDSRFMHFSNRRPFFTSQYTTATAELYDIDVVCVCVCVVTRLRRNKRQEADLLC
jgi:hypothetical protein